MGATKISISLDTEELRLARIAATSEGLTLSGYLSRALVNQLADQHRLDAARELHATWGPDTLPTEKDRDTFLGQMSRGRKRRAKLRKAA